MGTSAARSNYKPDYRNLTKSWDDDAHEFASQTVDRLRASGTSSEEAQRQAYLETNKRLRQKSAWESAVKGGMGEDEAEAFVRKEFDSGPPLFAALGGLPIKAGGPIGRLAIGKLREVAEPLAQRLGRPLMKVEDMERAAEERFPKTAIATQLGGALVRYGLAGMFGGPTKGPLALGALEAAVGRPDESMAGLVETGLGAMGMDKAAGVAKTVSENPYGRAVTDIGAGLGLNKLFSKLFSGPAKSTLSTIEQEAAADAAERVAKESGGTVETAVKAVDEVVPPIVTTKVKGKGRTKSTKKTRAELEEEVLGQAEQFIQRSEEVGKPLSPEEITKLRESTKAVKAALRAVGDDKVLKKYSGGSTTLSQEVSSLWDKGGFVKPLAGRQTQVAEEIQHLDNVLTATNSHLTGFGAQPISSPRGQGLYSGNVSPNALMQFSADEAPDAIRLTAAMRGLAHGQEKQLTYRFASKGAEGTSRGIVITGADNAPLSRDAIDQVLTRARSSDALGPYGGATLDSEGHLLFLNLKEYTGMEDEAFSAVLEKVLQGVPDHVLQRSTGQFTTELIDGTTAYLGIIGNNGDALRATRAALLASRKEYARYAKSTGASTTTTNNRIKAQLARIDAALKVADEAGGVSKEVLRPGASSVVSLAGKAVGGATPQSRVELKQQLTLREEAKESILDRAKELGQVIDPGTMAQLDARIAAARQALADIPLVKKGRGRSGAIDPSVLMGTARAGIGAVVGGGTGSQVGDTPEERQRNAMLGALAGAGIGAGIPAINRAAAQSESYRGAVDDISRLFRKTSKTAAPGPTPLTPLSPSGIIATTASATGGTFPLPTGGVKLAKDVILDPTAEKTVGERFAPMLRQLNLSPDMQIRLEAQIKAIGDKLGTVSFEDAAREAGRLLNTQRENLLDIATDRMTGTEVLAIASMLSENAQKIAALSSEAASATGAARDQLMDQADELYQQMPKMLKVIQSAKHAQGQALGQNRILGNMTTDPTFWILKGQRVKGAEVLTLLEQNTIVSLANSGKQEKLIQYLANIRRSPIMDQVNQLRKAFLLTSLAGRTRDLVGTGAHLIAETAQRAPASLADAVLSRVGSAKTGIATGELRSIAAPAVADLLAMIKAGKAGAEDAARSLGWNHKNRSWAEFIRDAEIDPEILKRYDVPNQINITMFGKGNIVADTFSKLALRASGVTDKLLFAPAYAGALREQASLKVLREGLTGDAAAKRAAELLKAPDEEMTAEAILAASTLMFNNDGTAAKMLSTFYAAGSRTAGPFGDLFRAGMDFLLPFRRTPANVLTRLIEHTPGVGLVPMVTRYRDWTTKLALAALESNPERLIAVRAAQRKLVQNAMRQGTGALASLGVGFYLYDQGVLTGNAPPTTSEKEQWLTEGKTANSILIGDNWYEVGRLSPYGNLLSMAANIRQDASREGKTSEERAVATGVNLFSGMLDQPMITGPRDLLSIDERDDNAENWIQKTAGSFVPAFISSIARSEGVRRQPQSILSGQAITSRIPGMQQGTPARLGIFGQQTEVPGGLFNVGVSPVPRQRDLRKSDPLVAELSRVGARIGAVDRPTGMDFGDYQNIQREVGPLVRDRLERIMSSPSYQQAGDERRKELIQKTVRNTRAQYTRSYTRSLKTR